MVMSVLVFSELYLFVCVGLIFKIGINKINNTRILYNKLIVYFLILF